MSESIHSGLFILSVSLFIIQIILISALTTLTIQPGEVTIQHGNSTLPGEGLTATLHCSVYQRGQTSLVWRQDRYDYIISNNDDVMGDITKYNVTRTLGTFDFLLSNEHGNITEAVQEWGEQYTLQISSVGPDDIGWYSCYNQRAGHVGYWATDKVYVNANNVDPDKTVIVSTNNREVSAKNGSNIEIDCLVARLGPTDTIKWYKDGHINALTMHDKYYMHQETHGLSRTQFFLKIFILEDGDRGRYRCQLFSDQSEYNDIILIVNIPPYFTDTTNAIVTRHVVVAGDRVTLSCAGTGYPTSVTFSWSFQGLTEILPCVDTSQSCHQDNPYISPPLKVTDRGTYTCEGTNGVNPSIRRDYLVLIPFAPEIVANPDVGQALGYDVVLRCSMSGFPTPTLSWHRGTSASSQALTPPANDPKYDVIKEDGTTPETDFVFTLKIKIVTQDDYGSYTCVARNERGVQNKAIELRETATCQGQACPNTGPNGDTNVTTRRPCVGENCVEQTDDGNQLSRNCALVFISLLFYLWTQS